MTKKAVGLFLLAIMLLASILYVPQAVALDCPKLSDIEEAYDYYDAIVVGTIKKIERKRDYNRVIIDVERSFKSVTERQLQIREDSTWGSIMLGSSKVGDHNLYFLKDRGDYLENTLCSHSKTFTTTMAELTYLADKELPLYKLPKEDFQLEITSSKSLTVWIVITVVIIILPILLKLWRRSRP